MHISQNMLLRGVVNSFIVFALLFSSGAHSIGMGQREVVTAKKWTPPTAELYSQVCDFIANELTQLEAFLERRSTPILTNESAVLPLLDIYIVMLNMESVWIM